MTTSPPEHKRIFNFPDNEPTIGPTGALNYKR